MVNVYLKNMRKSWLTGLMPSVILVGFVGIIAAGWPSMKELIIERLETMNNPIMQAILGDLGLEGLGLTWQAALFMYAGGTVNLLILFIAIFIPARLLSTEVDKNTFDVMLSFPIKRWRYLLEKFSVYVTYNLLLPISMILVMIGSSFLMSEEIDTALVFNYALSYWLLLFALGAISLLCASIFLDSNRSIVAAGVIVGGQYFLESLGGILEAIGNFQGFSLFHYFKLGAIQEAGMLPLGDVIIVLAIGFSALGGALAIFQMREFAI
jgi:ABC-type transport system involved in multi-copper enzyme maturation permease subunit